MSITYDNLNEQWFVNALAAFNANTDASNDEFIALSQLHAAWILEDNAKTAVTDARVAAEQAEKDLAAADKALEDANKALEDAKEKATTAAADAAKLAKEADDVEEALKKELGDTRAILSSLQYNITNFNSIKYTAAYEEPASFNQLRNADTVVANQTDNTTVAAQKAAARADIEVDAARAFANYASQKHTHRNNEFTVAKSYMDGAENIAAVAKAITIKALRAYNKVRPSD
jgi:hypothetical protein